MKFKNSSRKQLLFFCFGFSFSLFFGCSSTRVASIEPFPPSRSPSKNSEKHFTVGCEIADLEGNPIRIFPGTYCIFFKNGNLLQYQESSLVMYRADMRVLWSIPKLNLSHQLNLSRDGSEILTINGEYHEVYGKTVRFDTLLVIDLSGKIRKRFSLFENREKIRRKRFSDRFEYLVNDWTNDGRKDLSFEANHVNSFHEIPHGSVKFSPEPEYVVNCNLMNQVFLLDKELTSAIASFRKIASTHDVQVLENGNLLWYKNRNHDTRTPSGSSIEVVNPLSSEILWRYQGDKAPFFNEIGGGVQRLENGDLLISDNRDGATAELVSIEGKSKRTVKFKIPSQLQEARIGDFSEFLEKNRGL